MIEVRIREVAEQRGIPNAHQLGQAIKASPDTGAGLWSGDITRLNLETLDRLCRVLKCQPGALLKYVVEEDERPQAAAAKKSTKTR